MRGLLVWILLLAVFGTSALLRERWVRADRIARDAAWTGEHADDGFGRLTIGAPSGASPVALGDSPGGGVWSTDAPRVRPEPVSGDALSFEPPPPADFEVVVRAGQTLSQICESFYGTSRGGLVDRLAAYNGISSPDRIRAGDVLQLPGREVLE